MKRRRPGPRRGKPTGRPPTPADVLRRRGSDHRPAARRGDVLVVPEIEPGPPPAIPRTAAQWTRLLGGLPDFDPFRDAGDCWFDRATARRAIRFFHEELRHFKAPHAGQPFYLSRWQMAIVANLFGWQRPDGYRRFRFVFLLCGRKNGKTPFAAGLCLYLLFADGEAGAEVYSAAKEYKQACKVWEYAYGFVVQNAKLLTQCHIYGGRGPAAQGKCLQLGDETGASFYRPIASDPDSAWSFNTHAAVIDELHTQADPSLIEALETSVAARKQPLIIYITTSDYAGESPCNDRQDYAAEICARGDDPTWLPALFAAGEQDPLDEPATWAKANPNLDVSVTRDYLEQEARRALRDPTYRNTFKRVHLCIRTRSKSQGLAMEAWEACGAIRVDADELAGQPCWAGLDLASTTHSNALVLLFRDETAAKVTYRALAWFWLPEATIEEWEGRGQARYRVWQERGLIRATPGNVTDYGWIRRDINELADVYYIQEIAADRLFQGSQLCSDLIADGHRVIAFGQGFVSMTSPTKELKDLVLDRRFGHGRNAVLTWHAGNLAIATDPAGNMKPDRRGRNLPIDGIVSAIMALGRASADPEGDVIVEMI